MQKVDEIGQFRFTVSFDLLTDAEQKEQYTYLDEDILCNDENGDWILGNNGDWQVCNGERAFVQDLQESLHLKLFDDIIDPEQGQEFDLFRNAVYTEEKAIEFKHILLEFYQKDDRINQNTLEITIEHIVD